MNPRIILLIVTFIGASPVAGAELEGPLDFPIRGKLLSRGECDKYCWAKVEVLEALHGSGGLLTQGTTINVATLSSEQEIPEGESLLIVRAYGEEKGSWRISNSTKYSGIRSLTDLEGLTPGQCKELDGRVVGYDEGCSDNEICHGSVKFMMCPCWCCSTPAANSKSPQKSLSEIPESNPSLYPEVKDARHWQNPILIFDEKGIRIEARSTVSPDKLIAKLKALPVAAWPYGRVVVINTNKFEDPGPKYSNRLRKMYRQWDAIVQTNKEKVVPLLRENRIRLEEWQVLYPRTDVR